MDTVILQVTCRCPLHCEQCYMEKSRQEMEYETARGAVDQARARGARMIQITGGEPFTYPHLKELIQYCRAANLYTAVATSGYGHSPAGYAALYEQGLTQLSISLNSTSKIENKITRDGFELSMAAIQDVLSLGVSFAVNVVVSKATIDALGQTVTDLVTMGCEQICLLKRFPSVHGETVERLSRHDIDKIARVADAFPDAVHVENCFLDYWCSRERRVRGCRDAGICAYFVNVDGTISPCSQMTRCRYTNVEDMMKNADQWRRGYCYAENL